MSSVGLKQRGTEINFNSYAGAKLVSQKNPNMGSCRRLWVHPMVSFCGRYIAAIEIGFHFRFSTLDEPENIELRIWVS